MVRHCHLAGDGLLTLAFEWIATTKFSPKVVSQLTYALAHAAGPAGMVAGQATDVLGKASCHLCN